MEFVTGWTGHTACALQSALRLSNEGFAEHLGIATRTVAGWHQKPDLRPKSEIQQLLDTAYEQSSKSAKARFTELASDAGQGEPTGDDIGTGNQFVGSADGPVVQVRDIQGDVIINSPETRHGQTDSAGDDEHRLSADPNIGAALDWLDLHAEWEPGTARRRVAERLASLDVRQLRDRGSRRGRVDQRSTARALEAYYGDVNGEHGRYGARYGDIEIRTSVLTCPDWLDLDCPLVAHHDRLSVTNTAADADLTLNEQAAEHAVERLAETLALDVRLIDMPLYRLLDLDIRQRRISGSAGVTRFVGYALTMDLLENELVDALSTGVVAPERGSLPLRNRHLPDIASVLDVGARLCAGGSLALCAIARPANPFRGEADYLLLVQERSGHVLNATRRLAAIPKGFHQPMADVRTDAQIGATLRREMEEELFGRDDIDNTVTDQRRADPMHPSRLSEPMRWLMAEPGRLRMECTGFGLNLVSGNFEFPGLIVIEDEEFWIRFGGDVEANWNRRTFASTPAWIANCWPSWSTM